MTYEFDSRKYEKASAHQKEWGERLISELSLRGDERILDLGCGDGRLTAQLAELVPEGSVLGIDASSGMIEVAQKYRKDNLSFLLLDINSLDFKDEFDLVFSNATVHWIKDHNALLRKVWRSLRNDGVVRFNFAGSGNCSNFFAIVKTAMKKPRYAKYFSDFVWPWFMPTVDEYETIVRQFPFRDIRVWADNADHYFPDSQTMTKWIEQPSLVPFLKCIDQSDRQAFRDFVVQRMIEETRQDDETFFETFRRINVYARK
ncbi:MAG: methyltransferase domain-containing protein [Planctomycetes bacterium]|nr:methyltransferase domain-containing protein [Planctomycetota bacterium]